MFLLGTGGVSSWALKLSRAAGLKVILTSSSDEKLERMKKLFGPPDIQTVNYTKFPNWHEEVLKLTDGVGVDLTIDSGGSSSIVRSMKSTRRGGIVSQVGYLGNHKEQSQLQELVPTIIDRRIIYRSVILLSRCMRDCPKPKLTPQAEASMEAPSWTLAIFLPLSRPRG